MSHRQQRTSQESQGKRLAGHSSNQARGRETEENPEMFPFEKVNRMMTILTALQREPTSRAKNLKD